MRTWPPTTNGAWYSSLSIQLIFSGSHDGTVAANVPPGFNTRTSSLSAATSSWMCSSTSLVTTQSNDSLANGSRVASPRIAPPNRAESISPAMAIAANVLRVPVTSSWP